MSTGSNEDTRKNFHSDQELPRSGDRGNQVTTTRMEAHGALSGVLMARIEALETALAKQQLESTERRRKLIETTNTIDDLKAQIDQMAKESRLQQAQIYQKTYPSGEIEAMFDATVKNAIDSAVEKQDNAGLILGARVLELEEAQSRQREVRDTEVLLMRASLDKAIDSIGDRFELLETDLRTSCESSQEVNERLEELQRKHLAFEEQARISSEKCKKLKERVRQLDIMDKNRDEQADILMKHSEENRKRSRAAREKVGELRQLYEKNHTHVLTMFEEHEVRMRLLEEAVKNCEVRLKIRPKTPQSTKGIKTSIAYASGSAQQSSPAAVAGTSSASKAISRSSPAASKTVEKYRGSPAEFSPGPSEPAFRVPKSIVDPRYGNKINPELVQEMSQDKEHRRMFPDGCTDVVCWECRTLKRPR